MIREVIGYALLLIGGFFYFTGGLGILRMPDVYNRLQAGTKATTLGTFSSVIGVAVLYPQFWLKSLLIVVFIVLSNPIGSSVLARVSYLSGIKPCKCTKLDEYGRNEDAD